VIELAEPSILLNLASLIKQVEKHMLERGDNKEVL